MPPKVWKSKVTQIVISVDYNEYAADASTYNGFEIEYNGKLKCFNNAQDTEIMNTTWKDIKTDWENLCIFIEKKFKREKIEIVYSYQYHNFWADLGKSSPHYDRKIFGVL